MGDCRFGLRVSRARDFRLGPGGMSEGGPARACPKRHRKPCRDLAEGGPSQQGIMRATCTTQPGIKKTVSMVRAEWAANSLSSWLDGSMTRMTLGDTNDYRQVFTVISGAIRPAGPPCRQLITGSSQTHQTVAQRQANSCFSTVHSFAIA